MSLNISLISASRSACFHQKLPWTGNCRSMATFDGNLRTGKILYTFSLSRMHFFQIICNIMSEYFLCYIKQIFPALYSSNGAKYLPSVTGDREPTIALHLRCRAIVGSRSPVTLGRYFAPLPSWAVKIYILWTKPELGRASMLRLSSQIVLF